MPQPDRAKREAKRQRRHDTAAQRQEERRRRETQRRMRTWAIYGGGVMVVAVIVGLLLWSRSPTRQGLREVSAGTARQGTDPVVEVYADQGREHIPLGTAHAAYNSTPPTSGWHTPQVAPWGSHRNDIPDEVLIHNLEHGGIWISYKDPKDTALVEKLEGLASRYRSKVIVTSRPKNDRAIALAAWNRLMKLEAYDEGRIVAFIDAYRNKGPEQVPD